MTLSRSPSPARDERTPLIQNNPDAVPRVQVSKSDLRWVLLALWSAGEHFAANCVNSMANTCRCSVSRRAGRHYCCYDYSADRRVLPKITPGFILGHVVPPEHLLLQRRLWSVATTLLARLPYHPVSYSFLQAGLQISSAERPPCSLRSPSLVRASRVVCLSHIR